MFFLNSHIIQLHLPHFCQHVIFHLVLQAIPQFIQQCLKRSPHCLYFAKGKSYFAKGKSYFVLQFIAQFLQRALLSGPSRLERFLLRFCPVQRLQTPVSLHSFDETPNC